MTPTGASCGSSTVPTLEEESLYVGAADGRVRLGLLGDRLDAMLSIRPYESEDWSAIAAIHDAARVMELRLTVGEEAFVSLADAAENEGLFRGEIWVGTRDSHVVGFVAFSDNEITWLYVDPAHHRQGIGRALLSLAVERCGPTARTETLAGNAPALALYLSKGFEVVETRSGRLTGNEGFAATGHLLVRSMGS